MCFFIIIQDQAICVSSLKTVNIQSLPLKSCISQDGKDLAARTHPSTSASSTTESSQRMLQSELVRNQLLFVDHTRLHRQVYCQICSKCYKDQSDSLCTQNMIIHLKTPHINRAHAPGNLTDGPQLTHAALPQL